MYIFLKDDEKLSMSHICNISVLYKYGLVAYSFILVIVERGWVILMFWADIVN